MTENSPPPERPRAAAVKAQPERTAPSSVLCPPSSESPSFEFLISGLVQGVGFRPAVWRLATDLRLAGWVRNTAQGVEIHLEGDAARQADFLARLTEAMPSLARIEQIRRTPAAREGCMDFRIRESTATAGLTTAIGPDLALCPDCLAELFDPQSRRYRYPLLACTRCGPRYSVTRHLPYQRAATSLAPYPLCADCAAEYANPADRRFHAEAAACPVCGPAHYLLGAKGQPLAEDPAAGAWRRVQAGGIVAIKGLGGFHLVCDAQNPAAIERLRQRKNRDAKPFALMATNLSSLATWVDVNATAARLLTHEARPIVLLPAKAGLSGVAPDLERLGVMLPATAMQWLLLHTAAGCPQGMDWTTTAQATLLVMTSANPGGEPLARDNAEALTRLADIADAFWLHERDIVTRCDDSLLLPTQNAAPIFIRRARGYTPVAIPLVDDGPPVLALGAYLKNALCLTRGREAFLSQHIGSLQNAASLIFLEETVEHLMRTLAVKPVVIAHDLHPDYPSTQLAQTLAARLSVPATGIAHHHAHIAAVCAERHLHEPVLGLALDGVGLGTDGALWGGELLRVEQADCRRLGHLLPLPGGDKAALEPWRMGVALLHQAGAAARVEDWLERRFPALALNAAAQMLVALLEKKLNCPPTTSMGRVFDAAAALLGVCAVNQYEAQAATQLESLALRHAATHGDSEALPLARTCVLNAGVLDLSPLLLSLLTEADTARGAACFHASLARALVHWVAAVAEKTGIRALVAAGGCLQNALLVQQLMKACAAAHLTLYLPHAAPPGDGGLALGQAWAARAKILAGMTN
ncbi:MAG: carbamoyltransferase HypF [Zoogloeaceae bacterium]|jgi:hydrogenase maturation protein HypF|nr:carbamoyltransferase HypF [Zoogloeaceae bacterium]